MTRAAQELLWSVIDIIILIVIIVTRIVYRIQSISLLCVDCF